MLCTIHTIMSMFSLDYWCSSCSYWCSGCSYTYSTAIV